MLTRTSGANNPGKIAALGAGTAYYKLWCKSHLLMLMRRVPLIRFNLVKEQLRRPIADTQTRLPDRRQGNGRCCRKGNVVVPHNCHVVWYMQPGRDKTLQQTNRQKVIRCEYCSRAIPIGE